VIAQSTVIGRFLAKRHGLFGKDEYEAAQIDEILEAMIDFQRGMSKVNLNEIDKYIYEDC